MRRLHLVAGTIALTLVGGCSGGATEGGDESPAATAGQMVADVLAAVEGMSAEQRQEELLQLAEAEGGSVTLYTSISDFDVLAEAFEEDTGIVLLTYRAAAEDVRTRVLQEHQANRLEADVIAIGDSRLIPVRDEGILAAYESPHQEELVDGAVQEFWTLIRHNLYVSAWNTDLVAEGEHPASYEDLADPRWDGLMTMEPSDYDWYWSVSNYLMDEQGYTQEDVDEYWQQVANGSEFNSGHTSTTQLLIGGQYAVFTSAFSKTVEAEKQAGAPVEWVPPIEPVFATPEAAAIAASTPKPAAAVILMDWLISRGQEVLHEDLQEAVTRTDLQEAIAEYDVRFVDAEDYVEVESEVAEEYDALSAGGAG